MLVATIATVAAIATGIYFFSKKEKQIEPPVTASIIGFWKIDSCAFTKESSFLSLVKPIDSTSVKILEFGADSLLRANNDSTTLKYFVKNDSLVVNEANTVNVFGIKKINDSTINLSLDSTTTIHLTKK